MKAVIAVFVAALLAVPMAALASSPEATASAEIGRSVQPYISQEKAMRIVESWGILVSGAEFSYENGRAVWNVRGIYHANIGPWGTKLDVIVRLDAYSGSFVGLDVERNDDFSRNKIVERMREYGISVDDLELIRDYNPYWQVYGTKGMDVGGFWIEVPLTIRVDARSLQIVDAYVEPRYYIQGVQGMPEPYYEGPKATETVVSASVEAGEAQ